jgi:hypothetical protein
VTVSDGTGATCAAAIAVGSCALTSPTAGAKTLTATYAGDANFAGSASAGAAHTVTAAATTTTIGTDLPDPSVVGQAYAVTWTVAVTAPGTGTPTGTVTVSDGTGASCADTVAAGTCSLASTTAGAKSLTATYVGDANFSGSVSTGAAHTVNQATTTTAITTHSPDPSTTLTAVSVTWAVAVSAPGAGTPTGNVTVTDGVNSCSAAVAVGGCSVILTTLGTRSLVATYAGDTDFAGSTSPAISQLVL